MMPTQRRATPVASSEQRALKSITGPKGTAEGQGEEVTQFSLSLRRGLRKDLARFAADADMTMRAFVLNALKAQGLTVRDEDLLDLRRDRR